MVPRLPNDDQPMDQSGETTGATSGRPVADPEKPTYYHRRTILSGRQWRPNDETNDALSTVIGILIVVAIIGKVIEQLLKQ